jgi:tetratricopeptide (TPR) repeat protein
MSVIVRSEATKQSFSRILILIFSLFLIIPCAHADTAVQWVSAGNDAYKLGNLDLAIMDYTKAIDINPNYAKAYDNRGVAYARQGSLTRAIDDFTMAIATNFKDAEAYNNRGHAYEEKGNLTQAVFDYTHAIENNTFYVKAYNNRMYVYYQLKEYDKAWADVHTVEAIGGPQDLNFIQDLKRASGKDK